MALKCFFGHSFGKIEDGYQYCQKCGKANKIHPCADFHTWVDAGQDRDVVWYNDQGQIIRRNTEIAQKCSICSAHQSVWRYQ